MKKYWELIKYAFWGGISTAINLVILFALIRFTNIHYIIANTIAYFIAVIINYFCNKKFVFHSDKNVKKELISFIVMRLISLGVDNGLYYIVVDILGGDVYICRILLSIFIMAATYVINKLVIFKKGERDIPVE